ncbi:integral membrane sensor signal transduction histidine kinase [Nostoc sp. NIES-4103]|nr:integral membrane sensor signal transduction histidine kinase [Nostoc sp. NIES-4103]
MNLRKKLLTTFSGLALLTLVTAGMTVWAIAQWKETNEKLEAHFQRSLLLKNVRAASFRAFKEVPDAVITNDDDAEEEFEELLAPVKKDFEQWAKLADNEAERQQVEQVRTAYDKLVENANKVFNLVKSGQQQAALELMEEVLEEENFEDFEEVTDEAVESDLEKRQQIRANVLNTRQTTQLALFIIAFTTISLVLLLAAYLASDLFAPLREVKQALDDVAAGDTQRRLDTERADELGAINSSFNNMVEAIASREKMAALAAIPNIDATSDRNWQNLPSRVVLHQMVSQLRSRISQLSQNNGAAVQQQSVIEQLDLLSQAVARVTEFGFPLDLNLARTNIRALLYEAIQRYQAEFIDRAISIELDIMPEVNYALVDRLKLREALSELVRNALAALPETGGRLGMRTSIADGSQLKIEVADNGTGIKEPLIEQAFTPLLSTDHQRAGVGLTLTQAIIEQHGGQISINSESGSGTYVQILIPLRE